MATRTQNPPSQDPQPDNPNKTLTLESPHPPQPDLPADSHSASSISQQLATDGAGAENPTKDGEDSTAKGTEGDAAVVEAATGRGSPVNDIQKKFRRAERFGVPVQLSEKEKRNSRAERFGIASGSGAGSDGSKAAEEQKRKARAERFGLPVAEDEEAKKKARLARFAPQTKTDSVEEEKRKARAIRFSQTPSSSLSDVNGKGNVDTMTAISDKETGGA